MCLFAWTAVVSLRPKFNSGLSPLFCNLARRKNIKNWSNFVVIRSFHQQRNKFSSPFACKHDRWTPNQIEFEGKSSRGTASSVDLTVVMEINVYPAFPFPPHGTSSGPFIVANFINHLWCAADVPAIYRTSRRRRSAQNVAFTVGSFMLPEFLGNPSVTRILIGSLLPVTHARTAFGAAQSQVVRD